MVHTEDDVIKECTNFLLKKNIIEKKDINNIKKIYSIIEITDGKMFYKLKEKLRKEGWIT